MAKSGWRKGLAALLPGIFLIGYNVGTGSITAMSKAGANFGTDLLWAILLSCLITYFLMSLCGRFTLVTGKTLIEGMRREIHPVFALFIVVILSAIILSALIGVLSIISEVLHVWTETFIEGGISQNICATVTALVIYLLIALGDSADFQKVLAALVAMMAIAFIGTAIMEFPGFGQIVGGLVPSIPAEVTGSDNSPLAVVAAMVGTTVSVFVLVIRTGLVKEKAWSVHDLETEKRDATVSASLMFIVSAAVMITAAATLYVRDIRLNMITEMIPMLEPLFGSFALGVFITGIVAAGVSSHLPNLLVIPWMVDDYLGNERTTRTPAKRLALLGLTVFSLLGVNLGLRPVFLMLLSQASIAVVLPLVIGVLVFLTGSRRIMGDFTTSQVEKALLGVIMIFALYMSSLGIRGLVQDLSAL